MEQQNPASVVDVEETTFRSVCDRAYKAVTSGSARAIWRVTARRYISQLKVHLHRLGVKTESDYAIHMHAEESVCLETEKGRLVISASMLGCDVIMFSRGVKQIAPMAPREMARYISEGLV